MYVVRVSVLDPGFFRIRIELFFPESGFGSAENQDPIRKKPDPDPCKKRLKTVSTSRKFAYLILYLAPSFLVRFLQNLIKNII